MSLQPINHFTPTPTKSELESYQIIAGVAASNPYWKKLGGNGDQNSVVATILSVMLLARELGISPMQAISGGINNIQGKFEISARLMNQLIRKFGHKMKVMHSDNQICQLWSKRKDTGEELTETFTIEEAAMAGLIKEGGGWKKCPKDMLFARCISRMARRLYPDCIGGCYIEGELQETIQGKVTDAPELPPLSEFNNEDVKDVSPPTVLELPDDVQRERVETFLQESAEQIKMPVEDVKKRAKANMSQFLKTFKQWETQRFPQENPFEENVAV